MGNFRLYWKVAALALFALPGIGAQWIMVKARLPLQSHFPVLFHRYASRVIGMRRKVEGQISGRRPLMLVANHVSWLDIIALSAVAPVSFIAKSEVESWGIFGIFARLQRSVFVDRQRRTATKSVNSTIAERLKSGDVMVLFGEGTTGDGVRIKPFRSALIGAASEAGRLEGADAASIWLQPVSIAYTGLHGLPASRYDRAHTAWYGDMELLPHLKSIFRGDPMEVTISFGEALAFDLDSDRKQLAKHLEMVTRDMTVTAHNGRSPEIAELTNMSTNPITTGE